MTVAEEGVFRRAEVVTSNQLSRTRGRLSVLQPEERRAVEELAARIADAVAAELVEQAARDRRLAAALAAAFR
jgi:hypothetical protein